MESSLQNDLKTERVWRSASFTAKKKTKSFTSVSVPPTILLVLSILPKKIANKKTKKKAKKIAKKTILLLVVLLIPHLQVPPPDIFSSINGCNLIINGYNLIINGCNLIKRHSGSEEPFETTHL